jgi:hypothetical protein
MAFQYPGIERTLLLIVIYTLSHAVTHFRVSQLIRIFFGWIKTWDI